MTNKKSKFNNEEESNNSKNKNSGFGVVSDPIRRPIQIYMSGFQPLALVELLS
jgi:hypothetical protein